MFSGHLILSLHFTSVVCAGVHLEQFDSGAGILDLAWGFVGRDSDLILIISTKFCQYTGLLYSGGIGFIFSSSNLLLKLLLMVFVLGCSFLRHNLLLIESSQVFTYVLMRGQGTLALLIAVQCWLVLSCGAKPQDLCSSPTSISRTVSVCGLLQFNSQAWCSLMRWCGTGLYSAWKLVQRVKIDILSLDERELALGVHTIRRLHCI